MTYQSMKNFYFYTIIICIALILILVFQNIIMNQTAYFLTFYTNSGFLAFLSGILGFVAGGAVILFYYSKKSSDASEENDDTLL